MLTISSAQLDAWLAAFVFPLARLLGLMASAPVFSNAGMPRRVRLLAGLAVTMAIVPALPPMPAIATGSWQGLFPPCRRCRPSPPVPGRVCSSSPSRR